MLRKFLTAAAALLVLLLLAAPPAARAEPGPTEDLRVAIDEIIRVLGDKGIEPALRRSKVVEKIHAKFDFTAMSQFILGREWRGLDDKQRAAFVNRYARILENTYIGRIEAYTDEEVRYTSEERKDDKARIDTVIVSKSGQIPIIYKVRLKDDGHWHVYDVTIEGVSLVVNYQATYSEIMRKEGFDGLLKRMDDKLAEQKTR